MSQSSTINGYRSVGYFYGHRSGDEPASATLKDIFVSSEGGRNLTHLNFSFGNIAGSEKKIEAARARGVRGLEGVVPYTCFISDEPDLAYGESDTAGAAEEDFLRLFSAEESVAGVADTKEQALAGQLNQLRQVKQLFPDLRVLLSVGGWTWSKSFSDAVATRARRVNLAASCIDLWIRGNLPVIDGRGGPGAAADIFDGFDLDWEWPAAPADVQVPGNSVDPDNDRANFLEFAKELRRQLDLESRDTGKSYQITAFLPASEMAASVGGWNDPELFEYLDFGNLQGYDLWGAWYKTTGHQGNIYGASDPNNGRGIETVLKVYTDAGVDPAQLNLGMACYGYGWRGADRDPWGAVEGPATQPDGSAAQAWDALKRRELEIYHEEIDGKFSATYGFDAEAREWWTFDDPHAIREKTNWAIDHGMGGIDFWELGHDPSSQLVAEGAQTLRTTRVAAPRTATGRPGPARPS